MKEFLIIILNFLRHLSKPRRFINSIKKYFIKPFIWGKPRKTHFFLDSPNRVAYIVNSKAACTSIKSTLIKSDVDSLSIHSNSRNQSTTSIDIGNDNFTFTFVRNPFSRLVSLYRDRIERKKEKDYFNDLYYGYISRSKNFEQFVNRICLIPNIWSDRHFISQFTEITANGKHLPNFIGKIENIGEDFKLLIDKFNYDPVKHFNSTNQYNYKDYYSKKTIKKVYKRYKKDVHIFGYLKEYNELLNEKS